MGQNVFVFVVCGKRIHIDTLHFSLASLKRYSKNDIWVVTDSSRNETPVIHEKIVDIATPKEFDHHQASIFLKTGLHKFLPTGNNYCYLDTDVVAIDKRADTIFENFSAPITFAPDHCVMDQFSPSAVNCKCFEKYARWEKELAELLVKVNDLVAKREDPVKKEILIRRLAELKNNKWSYFWLSLRFNLSRNSFRLDADTYFDKKKRLWHDSDGQPVLYEKPIPDEIEIIESISAFRCNRSDNSWSRESLNVSDCRCNHLQEEIKKTFAVNIDQPAWQHWNGGVFLFNDKGHNFLETWHQNTLTIFKLPQWKTRDQGTLITTAWQLGMQNQQTLNRRFNLIADYHKKGVEHLGNLTFKVDGVEEEIKPYFVHVYHNWGNKNWDVWQTLERHTGMTYKAEAGV